MDLPETQPGTYKILRGFLKSKWMTNPLNPKYNLPGETQLSERYFKEKLNRVKNN